MTHSAADDDWVPLDIDTSLAKPNTARIYDYFLGGKDNYEVDRRAAEEVAAAIPDAPRIARDNRAFLQRAVHFMAEEKDVRQFIDIGSGLPTEGNVHEVAQGVDWRARVVYVDNDPIVLAHNRELLTGSDGTATVPGDMRRPGDILTHPNLGRLIDFGEPVAVLFASVLHFLTDDDDPAGVVARFREAMAPGSYLALSHVTGQHHPPEDVGQATRVYERATSSLTPRGTAQILRLFDGFELVEPGLVYTAEWRPAPQDAVSDPIGTAILAGVGRKN